MEPTTVVGNKGRGALMVGSPGSVELALLRIVPGIAAPGKQQEP
jgi:hypothetical protein